MCTLAIYLRTAPDFPVVMAANRDEFYDRPATAPMRLGGTPWVVAGQDLRAGGTWLGVNGNDLVAGILNRRSHAPPDPSRRSRGLLCLEVLQQPSLAAASERVRRDPGDWYNPFNLLIATPAGGWIIGNSSGAMRPTPLQPGLHLLTNLEINDFECPRIAKSYALFEAAGAVLAEPTLSQFLQQLRHIVSDHSTPLDPRSDGPPNNLCVHTELFGTRSSTVLVYSARERRFRMWHAPGAPCRTELVEIPLPS